MSDLTTQLKASVLTASLPLGEILARLRRGNAAIEHLSARLDKSLAVARKLERLAQIQAQVIERQKSEIELLSAHVRLMEAKERKRLSLVVNNTPAFLKPQAD